MLNISNPLFFINPWQNNQGFSKLSQLVARPKYDSANGY